MQKPPDLWLEHKGRAILDENGVGFFVYNELFKGEEWMTVVEVFMQKKESKWREKGSLYSRSHKLSPQTLEKHNKRKKANRRIAFKKDSDITRGLISALNEVAGLSLEEDYAPSEDVQKIVKSAEDEELKRFLGI